LLKEQKAKARAIQGFSSNWHRELSSFLEISEANWKRRITNTHTHTHTHTHEHKVVIS
jgi:hypothetical protein